MIGKESRKYHAMGRRSVRRTMAMSNGAGMSGEGIDRKGNAGADRLGISIGSILKRSGSLLLFKAFTSSTVKYEIKERWRTGQSKNMQTFEHVAGRLTCPTPPAPEVEN